MFDWSWIEELDGNTAADELSRSRDLVIAAEAGQFLLAAHWADLHAAPFVTECTAEVVRLPGMPRLVPSGPEGCPEIDEDAGAELAALVGRSRSAGEQMIRDAVTVRHRHPRMWETIKAGQARVWMAAKVARACTAAELGYDAAQWVDAQTTPYVMTLPPKRFFDLVEAKIIEADPHAAEQRQQAASLARFVRTGASDTHGIRTLVARAHAGDVTYLVAVLDRIAVILGDQGDPEPIESRRATALRVLANPARALALLTGAALDLDATDPALGHEPGVLGNTERHQTGEHAWMVDAHGNPLPGRPDETMLPVRDITDGDLALFGIVPTGSSTVAVGTRDVRPGGLLPSRRELRSLLAALERFDAGAFDPVTVVHVHLSEAALTDRAGVARVEELGPMAMTTLRDWLAHPTAPDQIASRITLRPVLDAAAVLAVDRYEMRGPIAELTALRHPYETVPFGTLVSRKADTDHVTPFSRGGPTSPDNAAPLGRRHHRIKTNRRWLLVRPEPGIYWWRTRHGHWFRLDGGGTHHHGRDPALDRQWVDSRAA